MSDLGYLFRFVITIDDNKVSRELKKFGECVLVLRQENQELIVISEKTGELIGKGSIETIKQ